MRCGTAPDGSCWCSAGALSCLEGFTNVCRGFPLSFRPYCFVFVGLRGGTWGVDLTAPQRLCKQFLEPECASASQPHSCHHFLRILQQCFFFLTRRTKTSSESEGICPEASGTSFAQPSCTYCFFKVPPAGDLVSSKHQCDHAAEKGYRLVLRKAVKEKLA